ncbi:Colicin I receptor [wastewater metagenome]|uniref:Colicin I receptor n=3 Tax=root TaxID=1 RepID=A0A5B8REF7_9ZZZZ|nr:colicin I receptor [uncultured organism]
MAFNAINRFRVSGANRTGGMSLCMAAACLAGGEALAQQSGGEVPTVTVTSSSASGHAVDRANAPASVSVITREELEDRSYRDITDALQGVPGVYVNDGPSSKGGTGEISIRGMDPKYTLIMVDGQPQGSDQAYYNGFGSGAEYGWLPPISAIERIEVIRGPMSSVYGSGGLGGIINVITRDTPARWGGSFTLQGTAQENEDAGDRGQGDYYVSGPIIDDHLAVSVFGSTFRRSEDDIDNGYREYDRDDTTARVKWSPNEANDVSVEAGYATQDTEGHADLTGSDSELETVRRHQSVSHDLAWGGGVRTSSYVQHAEMENLTQESLYERTTGNTRTVLPLASHLLTVGAQYRVQETENPVRAQEHSNLERWDMALFAEDEWMLGESFSLTTGARWVRDENYGNELVPRLYGVYMASPRLTVKGGVSAAYRTPDLKEGDSNWVEGGGGPRRDGADVGNSALEPEESITYELAALWRGYDGVEAGVTVFYTDYDNKIEKPTICDIDQGDPSCTYLGEDYEMIAQYRNVSEAHVQGAELSLGFPVGERVEVNMSYTFTDSEQDSGDNAGHPLDNQPRHRAVLGVNYRASEAARLWAKARYKGTAEQVVGRGGLSEAYPSYTLVDAGMSYRVSDRVRLFGGIYNLLDKEIAYEDYNRVLDGRRYNAGVTVSF